MWCGVIDWKMIYVCLCDVFVEFDLVFDVMCLFDLYLIVV